MKSQIFISIITFLLLLSNLSQAQDTGISSFNLKKKKANPVIYDQGEIGAPKANFTISATSTNTCAGLNAGTITITLSSGTPIYPVTLRLGNSSVCPMTGAFCQEIVIPDVTGFPYTFTNIQGSGVAYSVRATDNDAPTATVRYANNIPVVEYSEMQVTDELVTLPQCFGDCNGNIDINNINNANYPVDYVWNRGDNATGEGVVTLANVCEGSWVVTVTDAEGCIKDFTYDIVAPTNLTATFDSTNVSCFGANNGTVTVTPAGGTSPYTYEWSNLGGGPGGISTQNGLTPGSYSVTVYDSHNCQITKTYNITEPSLVLLASISSSTNPTCPTLSDGTITATGSGGTRPYSFTWNFGGPYVPDSVATGLSAGSYNVTITDANGCTSTSANWNITNPVTINASITSQTDVSCNAGSNGSATVTVSTGTANYSYTWSHGPTTLNSALTTNTENGLIAGNYTVTVTDANNCQIIVPFTINEPIVLASGISAQTDIQCHGQLVGSATVTISGGTGPYDFVWSAGGCSTLNSPLLTNTCNTLPAGAFTVNITDFNGCSSSTGATIIEPPALSGSITAQTNILCFGASTGSVTVEGAGGTPGFTYSIDGGLYGASGTFNAITAGAHSVSVKDANGCTFNVPVTITQPATALSGNISAQTNILCFGASTGSVTVAGVGGTPGYTYSIDGGLYGASGTFNALTAGAHSVSVKDANGCTFDVPVTITQPAVTLSGNITAQTNILCFGASNGSVTVSGAGGTPGYTYSIDGGLYGASGTFNALTAGAHSVSVKDANGCTFDVPVTITQPAAALSGDITAQTNILCFGTSTGSVTVAGAGGTPGYTYSINGGLYGASGTFNALSAGAHSISVKDANGCTFNVPVTITQPATALSGNITAQTNILCFGTSTGSVTVAGAGGTPGYTYSIDGGLYGASGTFNALSAGAHSVSVKDANGCTVNVPVNITQPAAALSGNITAQTNILCFGASTGSVTVAGAGGTPGYTYSIDGGLYGASGTFNALSAGVHSVSVKDANGCTVNVPVNITQPAAALSGNITAQTNIPCIGPGSGSVTVAGAGGTPGYTYSIDGGLYDASGTFNALSAGAHSVSVKDANGCTVNVPVNITQQNAPDITNAVVTDPLCFGNSGTVVIVITGGTPNYTYASGIVSSGAIAATNYTFNTLTAGTFWVTVTDNNSCKDSTQITMNAPPQLTVSIVDTGMSCGSLPSVVADQKFIPDGQGQIYSTSITQTDFAPGQTITSANDILSICASMEHSWLGDLEMRLKCPNGTAISLKGFPGGGNITLGEPRFCGTGGAGNLNPDQCSITDTLPGTGYSYCWSPLATTTMNAALPSYHTYTDLGGQTHGAPGNELAYLPSGDYLPNQSFAGLVGCPLNGVWAIEVQDYQGLDNGYIFSWQLNFNPTIFPDEYCNGFATALASGGTGVVSYSWDYNNETTAGIDSLCARWYHVTVTDENGCTSVDSAEITNVNITLALSQTDPLCNGDCNGTATVVPAGSYGFTFEWCNGDNTATADSLCAGNCAITVTDHNSCHKFDTVLLVNPVPLSLSATYNGVPCNGGNTGSLDLLGIGGTEPYLYAINGGPWQASGNFPNLTPGTYTPSVQDANGCTFIAPDGTINNPAIIVIDSTVATQIKCNGSNNGIITTYASGGSGPLSYTLNPGSITNGTNIFSNLSPGTYTVLVSDGNGCDSLSSPIIITEPSVLSETHTINPETPCFNSNNGSIQISVSGGTPPYTYQVGASTQISAAAVSFLNLTAGSYNVAVTDANLCPVTILSPMVIGEPTAINYILISKTNVTPCFGSANGSINATAAGGTGGLNYILNGGAPQVSGVFSGLSGGNYTIRAIDVNGCFKDTTITLTEPTQITYTPTFAPLTCTVLTTNLTIPTAGGTPNYAFDLTGQTTNATGNFPNLTAGTYYLTITDFAVCSILDTIIISPVAGITATSIINNHVKCFGEANGNVDITVAGGTPPFTYTWSCCGAGSSATNLIAGNYEVTVTDNATSCTSTTAFTITQPDALQNSFTIVDGDCASSAPYTGSATTDVTGGTGPYTYLWDDNSVLDNISAQPAGQYSVTITDANLCELIDEATINDAAAGTLSFTNILNNTCWYDANGSIEAVINGGTPPQDFQWDDPGSQTTPIATNLTNGTYEVHVIDANNCQLWKDTVITSLSPQINITNIDTTAISCSGINDGTITITANGGANPLNYSIDGVLYNLTANITDLAANDYIVYVQDANLCTDTTRSINIPNAAAINVDLETHVSILCSYLSNGSINIDASGGTGTLTFDNGITSNTTGDFIDLLAGTYVVTISDDNGCNVDTTVIITIADTLLHTTAITPPACSVNNGEINISASGGSPGYSYFYNNTLTPPALATVNPIVGIDAGMYQIIVTDANGCSDTSIVTLSNPGAGTIDFTLQQENLCSGDAVADILATVTGGNPGFTYAWSPNTGGQNTDLASDLGAGTYDLTVTDALGCETIDSYTINPIPGIIISINAQVNPTCYGDSTGSFTINASGGTGVLEYSLDGLLFTGITSYNSLPADTYYVWVRDVNNCIALDTVYITQPEAIALNLNTQQAHCHQNDGKAIVEVTSGGIGNLTYLWDNFPASNGPIANNLISGTYHVTVTDANGCFSVGTAVVTDVDGPAISFINVLHNACFGNTNGTATVDASGGTLPYTYAWDGGLPLLNNAIASNLLTGYHDVIVTDAGGCTSIDSIEITSPSLINFSTDLVQHISCYGAADGIISVSATGGTGNFLYSSNGGAFSASNTFTPLTANTYTIVVQDDNLCQQSVIIDITEPTEIILTETFTPIICNNDNNASLNVTAAGGSPNYMYSINGTTFEVSGSYTNLIAGSYTVTVTDANNCQKTSASYTVTNPELIVLSMTISAPNTCLASDGDATVTVSGGVGPYTYLWDANALNQITPTASNLTVGGYWVTVTDSLTCQDSTVALLVAPLSADVNVTATADNICFGGATGEATATATGGTPPYNFTWDNGQTDVGQLSSNATNLTGGTHLVTVTDGSGCETPGSVIIGQPEQISALINQTDVSCSNTTDGTIDILTSGGSPAYTFSIDGGTTYVLTNNFNSLAPGTYSIFIQDANNCTQDAGSVTIGQPSPLTFNAPIVTDVKCYGSADGTISITAQGGTAPPYSYSIDGSQQLTGTFINLEPGSYIITVTDVNNCEQTSNSIVISEPAEMILMTAVDSSNCLQSDGIATVGVTAGGFAPFTYLWDANAFNSTSQQVQGLPAGCYTVTVTDNHLCTASIPACINDVGTGILTVSADSDNLCFGDSTGSATATITGGSGGPYQYLWDNNEITQTATHLTSGTHFVEVTNGAGCVSGDTVQLIEPTSIDITFNNSADISCYGDLTGSISVSASGGTGLLTYSINGGSPSNTTGNFTNLPAGSYVITVTDANACSNTSATIILSQPAQLTLNTLISPPDCGINNGSISIIPSGGTLAYTYLWNNGITNSQVDTLSASLITITVTDGNNCQQDTTINLTNLLAGAISFSNIIQNNCFGDAIGSATIVMTGGTAPFDYVWNTTPVQQDSVTAVNLPEGVIHVTVTDASGCISKDSIQITQPTQLTAVSNISVPIPCFGDSGTFVAVASGGTPGYIYILGNDTNMTGSFTLPEGNYIVTVNDTLGCTVQSNSISLTQPSEITLEVTSTPSTCTLATGSASVNAVGGTGSYDYLWTGGGTNSTISNISAGIYNVTVTDANGCTANDIAMVSDSDAGTIDFNPITNNNCFGDSTGTATVVMTGGTSPFTYNWDNGDILVTADTLTAGTHYVSVTDAVGCITIDTVEISEPSMLQVSAATITNASCYSFDDGSIQTIISGGSAPYNCVVGTDIYITSDTLFADTLLAGSYEITVTDNNGCVYTIDTLTVGQPDEMVITSSITAPACNVADGTASVSVTGGTLDYSYLWCNGQTNDTAINMEAGTCWVTVTDSHACTDSLMVLISNMNAPDITLSNITDNLCFGDSLGTITANASGGTPFAHGYDYLWTNIPPSTSSNAINLPAGSYSVSVTDSLGCVAVDTATITQPELLILTLSDTSSVSCYGLNNGFIIVTATGGTPGYQFSSDGNTFQSSPAFNGLAGGIYTITGKDTAGCIKTISNIPINEPDSMHTDITKTDPTCSSGTTDGSMSVAVNGGNPGYTFLWSNGVTTASNNSIAGGTYIVTVTDQNLCSKTDSASIMGTVEVYANAGPDSSVCQGTKLIMDGSGGDSFKWIPALNLSSDIIYNPELTAEQTTTFALVATIGLCSDTDYVTITVKHIDPVDAGEDVEILIGETTTLNATCSEVNPVYQWTPVTGLSDPTILTPTVDIQSSIYYYITATSTNGCTSTDSVKVTVIPRIQYAEGFSPNGDGINDVWEIRYHEYYTDINVSVYNRWGELLFYNKGCTEYWNGTFNGKELPVGTYYYVITVEEKKGRVVLTGPVSIIK